MSTKGRILVVDDEASLRLLLSKELSRTGFAVEVVSDGERALELLRENPYNIVLLDIVMPNMDGLTLLRMLKEEGNGAEVIMLTGNATIESAIECMKLGAFEYVRKPYQLNELLIQIERAMSHQRSQLDLRIMREELERSGHRGGIVGRGSAIVRLNSMIAKVAPTQSTVLVLGESGSGKELVARSIHDNSLRGDKQFVAINCASFSETLLESELFGYEKGAFTDAKTTKRGLAEIADGGTLFLDEIGEIPIRFQAKLLRFLETNEIRRVGGTRDIILNVRILCATNKPLEQLIAANEFREDLYYRLNVLSIQVPPLRDRREDIPLLVEHFLSLQGRRKEFDRAALDALVRYDWPGNVRELKNLVERLCIMSTGPSIVMDDLSFLKLGRIKVPPGEAEETIEEPGDQLPSLQEMERLHIIKVLKHVRGHKGRAAELLQINPKTLYNKMRVYNIVSVYA